MSPSKPLRQSLEFSKGRPKLHWRKPMPPAELEGMNTKEF